MSTIQQQFSSRQLPRAQLVLQLVDLDVVQPSAAVFQLQVEQREAFGALQGAHTQYTTMRGNSVVVHLV